MRDAPQKGTKEDLISSLADARERLAQAEHLLKVEEALDRIRIRTMRMRASEEMAELVALVFEELHNLGFENQSCALVIIDEATHDSLVWRISDLSQKTGKRYLIPAFDHPVYNNMIRGWQDQSSFFLSELKGQTLTSYYKHLFENSDYRRIPDRDKETILNASQVVWTMVFMKHGALAVVDYGTEVKPLEESRIQILKKVAQTFDLTYTRFLDLLKAEAQTKEARQEASVNRIRAEIVSMKTSRDLERISTLLWTELTGFKVAFIRCGIMLVDGESKSIEVFLTRNDGTTFEPFTLPYQSLPTFPHIVEAWQKQEIYVDAWDTNVYDAWAQYLIQQGIMLPVDRDSFEEAQHSVNLTFLPFAYGHLFISSHKPLLEKHLHHLKRLADAFSVAFARYHDFKLLEQKNEQLASTLNHLENTQSQLVESEKLASLGKLTAGIAHEIKNPLNFVNNFAGISVELAEELSDAIRQGEDYEDVLQDLTQNAQQIAKHGQRAASIVNSMMLHASGSQSIKQKVNINTLISEYINLAYHGMRARVSNFNTSIQQEFDDKVGAVEIIPQDIGRVLINLFNNAFFAMHELAEQSAQNYNPTLRVQTARKSDAVEIQISDNGPGIPEEIQQKIFEPFFTTKTAGKGTGLGLSLSYDIITKDHQGTIRLDSEPGKGTMFTISLPV